MTLIDFCRIHMHTNMPPPRVKSSAHITGFEQLASTMARHRQTQGFSRTNTQSDNYVLQTHGRSSRQEPFYAEQIRSQPVTCSSAKVFRPRAHTYGQCICPCLWLARSPPCRCLCGGITLSRTLSGTSEFCPELAKEKGNAKVHTTPLLLSHNIGE